MRSLQLALFMVSMLMMAVLIRPDTAQAQLADCSVSSGLLTFSGFDILSGEPVAGSTTVNVTCDFLTTSSITVCLGINAGTAGATGADRHLSNGLMKMTYRLYQDPARTILWGSDSDPALGNALPVTMSAPFPRGTTTVPVTIYGLLNGSQTEVPIGNYLSNLTITVQYPTVEAPLLSDCSMMGNYMPAATQSNLNVLARLIKSCHVTTQDIDFGSHQALDTTIEATGKVNVTCTGATSYAIGLEMGEHTATTRRMKNGSDYIIYGLYQDGAYQQPWGTLQSGQAKFGVGNGLTQAHTVYGRVLPQKTPPVKTYTDSVAVTITY